MYNDDFCRAFDEWRKREKVTLIRISRAINAPVSTVAAWLLGYNPIPQHMKEALECYMKENDSEASKDA